jgi:lysophospholipase L1-like esterase
MSKGARTSKSGGATRKGGGKARQGAEATRKGARPGERRPGAGKRRASRSPAARRSSPLPKLALSGGAVILVLLVAEAVLRLTGIGPVRPGLVLDPQTAARVKEGVFAPDDRLLWVERPGPGLDYGQPAHFLQPGEPLPAKGSAVRVLCIGDSCTRLTDQGVPYSLVLAQELGTGRAEVFNASLPGYTSYQGRAWLQDQLLGLKSDYVVIYFGWNDHWRSTGFTDRRLAELMRPLRPRLLNLLVRPQDPPPLRVAQEDYAANLQAMVEQITAQGGRAIIVLAPHHMTPENQARLLENHNILPHDDSAALHARYLRIARLVAQRSGAEVLDAAAVFDTLSAWNETLMLDGIHPTQVGHVILALMLNERIATRAFGDPPRASDTSHGWTVLSQTWMKAGRWREALAAAEKAALASPQAPGLRLSWAWTLATCPVDSLRDGKAALAVLSALTAEIAATADNLEVEAAALAAAGRFEEATATVEQALRILDQPDRSSPGERARVQQLQQRRDAYARKELGL